MLNIQTVVARDLPDLWFQAVYNILRNGREFTIDKGSYAGQKRLEYDYFVGHVTFPGNKPLLPDIPAQYNIPNPVEEAYLYGGEGYSRSYIEYLMTPGKELGEAYTYGERLTKAPLKHIVEQLTAYPKAELTVPHAVDGTVIFFDGNGVYMNQIEWVIETYKNHGHRNNQMVMQIASPTDLLLKDPPCFLPGAPVVTAGGVKKIMEVVVGDLVLTHNGRWRRVTNVHTRKYTGDLFIHKIGGLYKPVVSTAEHPFLAVNSAKCPYDRKLNCKPLCKKQATYSKHGKQCPELYRKYTTSWVNAEILQIDHTLITPVVHDDLAIIPKDLRVWDKDMWFLAGLWLAEGDYSNGLRFNLGCHANGDFALAEIARITGKHKLGNLGKLVVREGSTQRQTLYSVTLERQFLSHFGKGARTKKLAPVLLALSLDKLQALVNGWVLGDGYSRKENRYVSVATSSEALKDFFTLALGKLGHFPSVRRLISKEGCIDGRKITGGREYFILSFTKFPKKSTTPGWVSPYAVNRRIQEKTQLTCADTLVYNLEVEEDNSYVCYGVSAHNCLRSIDTRIQDGKLHFVVYFRSWDLWGGFPANLAAIQHLKEYMAGQIGVEDGELIAESKGLHLYDYAVPFARMRCMCEERNQSSI